MYETMLDRFDLLIADSPLCAAALADAGTTEFELIRLKPAPLTPRESRKIAEHFAGRGFRCIGIIGLVQGVPRCALDAPLDARQTAALLAAFLTYCQAFLNGGPAQSKDTAAVAEVCALKSDFVRFAESLYAPPDTRTPA